jgi:hypothetical protein
MSIERPRHANLGKVIAMPGGATSRDLAAAGESPETTCLIRLWAVLHSYHHHRQRDLVGRTTAIDLIHAIAGTRRGRAIIDDVRGAVHKVRARRHRPSLERDEPAPAVIFVEAHSASRFRRLLSAPCRAAFGTAVREQMTGLRPPRVRTLSPTTIAA